MHDRLLVFERIVRTAVGFTEVPAEETRDIHPFDLRDLHPQLPPIVRDLFDDGHYAQATFEAFKFLDKVIQQLSGESETGFKLMMKVFPEASPTIKLTTCSTQSEKDEQKGYQFLSYLPDRCSRFGIQEGMNVLSRTTLTLSWTIFPWSRYCFAVSRRQGTA
jgi:hypothetical protein